MSLVNWMRWKLQSSARDRPGRGWFANAGDAFDQQVTTGEDRNQGEADDLVFGRG